MNSLTFKLGLFRHWMGRFPVEDWMLAFFICWRFLWPWWKPKERKSHARRQNLKWKTHEIGALCGIEAWNTGWECRGVCPCTVWPDHSEECRAIVTRKKNWCSGSDISYIVSPKDKHVLITYTCLRYSVNLLVAVMFTCVFHFVHLKTSHWKASDFHDPFILHKG